MGRWSPPRARRAATARYSQAVTGIEPRAGVKISVWVSGLLAVLLALILAPAPAAAGTAAGTHPRGVLPWLRHDDAARDG